MSLSFAHRYAGINNGDGSGVPDRSDIDVWHITIVEIDHNSQNGLASVIFDPSRTFHYACVGHVNKTSLACLFLLAPGQP